MRLLLITLGLVVLLAGCAPKTAEKHETVFFPPAPDPPRIQFLMGIGSSRDVEGSEVEYSLFSMEQGEAEEVKFFVKPYGIASFGDNIYVSDSLAGKVAVINLREKSFEWLKGTFGPGKLVKPINLVTDNEGNLFVTDTIRKCILMYDPEGNFLREYGSAYDMKPVDVSVDDKNLYVLDYSRNKIQVLRRSSGKLVDGFGDQGDDKMSRLALPTNMAMTDKGVFYVTNVASGAIVQLDKDGHVLGTFGKMGTGFGQFGRPRGIAVDSEDRLFIVDSTHNNVQIFNDQAKLLMFFGKPETPYGALNLPAGITTTKEGLDLFQPYAAPDFELEEVIMVVNQVGEHRIGFYGLGKKRDVDYEAYYEELYRKKLEAARKKRAEEQQTKDAKK